MGSKCIDDAGSQWYFWPNDGKPDRLLFGKMDERRNIRHLDGDVFYAWFQRGAAVSGCDKYFRRQGRLPGFPCQGVFSSAVTDDEDVHILMLKVSYSSKYHRDACLVCGVDDFLIPNRAPWLNDRCDLGIYCSIDGVSKGEKSIGRHD